MLLSRRRSASLVCVTAFAVMSAAPSYGASLEVAPTTLRVNADSGATVLYVANRGRNPIVVQIEGLSWQQAGSSDELKPTDAIIVSPPMARINPGEKQTVRLMVRPGGAPGTERTFRILASELPDPAITDAQAIRVLLQFNIPLFVGSPAATQPDLSWDATLRDRRLALTAHNPGAKHLKLSKLALVTATGQRIDAAVEGFSYVLSGATHEWNLAAANVRAGDRLTVDARAEDSDAAIHGTVVVRP